tara:strand:+ start:240 stop:614 length:375 start_codon:yes stop_codon:yes gene_type:complete
MTENKNENENNSSNEQTFTGYLQTQSGLAFLGFFALALILGSWAAFRSLDNNEATSSTFEGVSSEFLNVTEGQIKAIEAVDSEVSEEITVTASPVGPIEAVDNEVSEEITVTASPIEPTVITAD